MSPRFDKLPSCSGIRPCNILLSKPNIARFCRLPNSGGMLPVSRLCDQYLQFTQAT